MSTSGFNTAIRDQYFACCIDFAAVPPKCTKLVEDDFFIFQYGGAKPYYFKFDMQQKGEKSIAWTSERYDGEFRHATPITRYARCKYHTTKKYCSMKYENGVTTFEYLNRLEIYTFSAPEDGVIVAHTIVYKPRTPVIADAAAQVAGELAQCSIAP